MTGRLSNLVGGAIGLAKEMQADHKQRKEAGASNEAAAHPEHADHDDDDDDEVHDDEGWAQDLDAAQPDLQASNEPSGEFDQENWADSFIKNHPPPSYNRQQPQGVLSMPVIIPQRRPGSKTRGFVRAYAPILEDAGIDEKTWMDFLLGFEKSIGKNNWFNVLNFAVFVAEKIRFAVEGFSLIARLVTAVVHGSLETGRRTYMNKKHNTFIDRMNDEFFRPRGLYCLIIKYDPKSNESEEIVDVETNVVQQVGKRDDEDRSKWRNYTSGAAGKVRYEDEIPEFAPLVFPNLDNLSEGQKQNAMKHYGSVVADYYDRRAQAAFDYDHEDSKLAGVTPRKEFASVYADPHHAANQGGFVNTLSAGKYQHDTPLQRLSKRRNAVRSSLGISRKAGREGRQERKQKRPSRRLLKQDMLYLLVVNMPSQEEMDLALAQMEKEKQEKKKSPFGH